MTKVKLVKNCVANEVRTVVSSTKLVMNTVVPETLVVLEVDTEAVPE